MEIVARNIQAEYQRNSSGSKDSETLTCSSLETFILSGIAMSDWLGGKRIFQVVSGDPLQSSDRHRNSGTDLFPVL